MTRLLLLVAVPVAAQDVFELGARIFRTSCAVGYCHGSGGTQGRAPKLLGRAFDRDTVLKITRDGVPNTGMPGWKDRLNPAELDAVVAYVVKISGGSTAGLTASSSAAPEMPAPAKRGKELFTDPIRGVRRCNTCHILEGVGNAVGPNLAASGPYDAAALRQGKSGTVRMAALKSGDRFPALIAEQGDQTLRLYDLTAPPPVLRTLAKGEVSFRSDSPWTHAKAVDNYTDQELVAVAEYIKWLASH